MTTNEALRIATAVAAELGGGWTVTPFYDYAAKMTNGDVEMFARIGTYGADRGRVTFSTSYPDGWTDVTRYAEEEHRVSSSAALDRAPAAVAKQLRRTVLPAVEHWTPIFRERIQARTDAESNRRAQLERITAILPGAHDKRGDATDVGLYPVGRDWYGDVSLRHDGTRGDVDLRGLSTDTILRILELAKGDNVSSS